MATMLVKFKSPDVAYQAHHFVEDYDINDKSWDIFKYVSTTYSSVVGKDRVLFEGPDWDVQEAVDIVKRYFKNRVESVTRVAKQAAVTRSLTELVDQAKELGLQLPPTYGKQEVIDLLTKYYWEKENPGKPMPEYVSPMLIKNITDLPEEKQKEIWESPDWAIEKKLNGIRCLSYLGSSPTFTSRSVSVVNFLPESLTRQLFWLNVSMPDYEGTAIDGEIICTKNVVDLSKFTKSKGTVTNDVLQAVVGLLMVERSEEAQKANGMPLKYVLYDIMRYKGKNIKDVPYKDRRTYLEEVFIAWQGKLKDPSKLEMNASVSSDKRKFFEQCIAEGGEGCVTKWNQGIYKEGPTRTHEQYKIKRQTEVDAVVTGFQPPKTGRLVSEGLVGALEFSTKDITDGNWYRVAAVSNLDWNFRREISIKNPDGSFKEIKPECYDWVFELEGQEWNKNAQLVHARISRPRYEAGSPDFKSKEDCTFDRQAILKGREEKVAHKQESIMNKKAQWHINPVYKKSLIDQVVKFGEELGEVAGKLWAKDNDPQDDYYEEMSNEAYDLGRELGTEFSIAFNENFHKGTPRGKQSNKEVPMSLKLVANELGKIADEIQLYEAAEVDLSIKSPEELKALIENWSARLNEMSENSPSRSYVEKRIQEARESLQKKQG